MQLLCDPLIGKTAGLRLSAKSWKTIQKEGMIHCQADMQPSSTHNARMALLCCKLALYYSILLFCTVVGSIIPPLIVTWTSF